MKKILFLVLFIALLVILRYALYYMPFLSKNILEGPMSLNNSVTNKDGIYVNIPGNTEEKMIYLGISLKPKNDYIIEFDIEAKSIGYQPTLITSDFAALDYDKPDQEFQVSLNPQETHKKVFRIINSMDAPDKALFRIFHYSPNEVAISNIRVIEFTRIGYAAEYLLYFLSIIISCLALWQIFITRKAIYDKAKIVVAGTKNYLAERIGFGPNSIFLWLVTVYLFFIIIRFTVSLLIQNPLIPTDELAYKNMAYSFFRTGNFYNTQELSYFVNIPNVLYQFIISISFLWGDNFFTAIKLINAITMNLMIFPVYVIARGFVSEKKALLSGITVLLLPSLNYINFAMIESLYFPLFLFCFLFAYKSFTGLKTKYDILCGFFVSLLFLTKPTAIAFLGGYFLTAFCIAVFLIWSREIPKLKKIGVSVSVTTLSFLVCLFLLNLLLGGGYLYGLGMYNTAVSGSNLSDILSGKILSMMFGHISTFFFLYLIPFAVTIWGIVDSAKEKKSKELLFLMLGICLFAVHLLMVFKYTAIDCAIANEDFKRLHARYYSMAFPFFIISFVFFSGEIKWNLTRKVILLVSFLALSFANILYFFPKYANIGLLIVDNPDLTWFLFKSNLYIIVVSALFLMVILYYLLRKRLNYLPYLMVFLAFTLYANYEQIKTSVYYDGINSSRVDKYKYFIKGHINDLGSSVVLVDSGLANRLFTAFWFPYKYVGVYDMPKDSLITKDMIPDSTQYIILFDDYNLDFETGVEYKKEQCRIISLSDKKIK